MNNLNPDDFEEILDAIREKINTIVKCEEIRSIESNFNTKAMRFRTGESPSEGGTIIVGEDNGAIAVDISLPDGAVRSFILHDKKDMNNLDNIVGWFTQNYSNLT